MKYSGQVRKIARLASLSMMVVLLLVPTIAYAYMATQYATTTDFSVGSLVAFDKSGKPVAASLATTDYAGVVSGKSQGAIDIATSGTVSVLVSDTDGPIVAGSRVGLSLISGVATLWETDREMIGISLSTVASNSSDWKTVKVSNGNNTTSTIKIAQVLVQLSQDTGSSASIGSGLVGSIQQAANNLIGHSVAIWQIIAFIIVGLGSVVLAFGLLFSSGREAFLSLGRNPMASKVILRGMWRIVAVSVSIMVIGLVTSYLILRVGS